MTNKYQNEKKKTNKYILSLALILNAAHVCLKNMKDKLDIITIWDSKLFIRFKKHTYGKAFETEHSHHNWQCIIF